MWTRDEARFLASVKPAAAAYGLVEKLMKSLVMNWPCALASSMVLMRAGPTTDRSPFRP